MSKSEKRYQAKLNRGRVLHCLFENADGLKAKDIAAKTHLSIKVVGAALAYLHTAGSVRKKTTKIGGGVDRHGRTFPRYSVTWEIVGKGRSRHQHPSAFDFATGGLVGPRHVEINTPPVLTAAHWPTPRETGVTKLKWPKAPSPRTDDMRTMLDDIERQDPSFRRQARVFNVTVTQPVALTLFEIIQRKFLAKLAEVRTKRYEDVVKELL